MQCRKHLEPRRLQGLRKGVLFENSYGLMDAVCVQKSWVKETLELLLELDDDNTISKLYTV